MAGGPEGPRTATKQATETLSSLRPGAARPGTAPPRPDRRPHPGPPATARRRRARPAGPVGRPGLPPRRWPMTTTSPSPATTRCRPPRWCSAWPGCQDRARGGAGLRVGHARPQDDPAPGRPAPVRARRLAGAWWRPPGPATRPTCRSAGRPVSPGAGRAAPTGWGLFVAREARRADRSRVWSPSWLTPDTACGREPSTTSSSATRRAGWRISAPATASA